VTSASQDVGTAGLSPNYPLHVGLTVSGDNSKRSVAIGCAITVCLVVPANAQDVFDGEDVFKRCRACHLVGDAAKNAVGPKLIGLFGRKAGSIEGFNCSEANKNSGVAWDGQTFATYIKDPRAFMPGNRMAFAGVKDGQEVSALAAYLKQFDADGIIEK
jgi:cytochrome c